MNGIAGRNLKWDNVGHAAIVWLLLGIGLYYPCYQGAHGYNPTHSWMESLFLFVLLLPTFVLSVAAFFRGISARGGWLMVIEGLVAGLGSVFLGLVWTWNIVMSRGG